MAEDTLLADLGFLYVCEGVKAPHYKTPGPIVRKLYKRQQVDTFLTREQEAGRLRGVDGAMFKFTSRKRKVSEDPKEVVPDPAPATTIAHSASSFVDRLTRNSDLAIDHKRELCRTATELDTWLMEILQQPYAQDDFQKFKQKVMAAEDIETFLQVVHGETAVMDIICSEYADLQLAEIAGMDAKQCPLGEFPPDINTNIYQRIVEFGMARAPRLTSHVARLVLRSRAAITPRDVLRIASTLATICHLANRNLDCTAKLRSLTLQAGGLTNHGMDILAELGMGETARAVCWQKDMFAEAGPQMMLRRCRKMPTQRALDNVDFDQEHLMLDCVVQENVDTSNLSTVPMAKESALKLFTLDLLLLNSPGNAKGRDHLLAVMLKDWGRKLAVRRGERAAKLANLLPKHLPHSCSAQKILPTVCTVKRLYPCQETSHSDMLELVMQVQAAHLDEVAEFMGRTPVFMVDVAMLQDMDATVEAREAAEVRVHAANQCYGEFIGHGDQLTVDVWQQCRNILAQNVTAFGRLEYCGGPFRLEGMHSKMTKVSHDLRGLMKNEINFDDECNIAQLSTLLGKEISNKKKKIIKNDSSFERHDQFVTEVGTAYGLNIFDNYDHLYPERLDAVGTKEEAFQYISDMLDEYDVLCNLFYEPALHDPSQAGHGPVKQGEDDLLVNCREGFIRSLLSTAYDTCEAEGDPEAWLALRQAMVTHFLASNLRTQSSKYAASTMLDIVVELAASERTRARMRHHMVTNPSGTRTGGIFFDKACEGQVRESKGVLRSCHGKVDDLLLQKAIQGLAVVSAVTEHDSESVLHGKHGKEKSHDYVGDKARCELERQVSAADPFDRSRSKQHIYHDRPRGSPYTGLVESELVRFVSRMAGTYSEKY